MDALDIKVGETYNVKDLDDKVNAIVNDDEKFEIKNKKQAFLWGVSPK